MPRLGAPTTRLTIKLRTACMVANDPSPHTHTQKERLCRTAKRLQVYAIEAEESMFSTRPLGRMCFREAPANAGYVGRDEVLGLRGIWQKSSGCWPASSGRGKLTPSLVSKGKR